MTETKSTVVKLEDLPRPARDLAPTDSDTVRGAAAVPSVTDLVIDPFNPNFQGKPSDPRTRLLVGSDQGIWR